MHPSEVPPLLAGTFDKAKHIDKMRAKGKSDQEIEVGACVWEGRLSVCLSWAVLRAFVWGGGGRDRERFFKACLVCIDHPPTHRSPHRPSSTHKPTPNPRTPKNNRTGTSW